MTTSTVVRRRGLGARLVPFIIALGAVPLMAPTCGASGEGVKVFARRSLIIPMDVCYQNSTDWRTVKDPYNNDVRQTVTYSPAGGSTECPTPDNGDVIKAYGLVYQLVRNGVAVYWVIDGAKTDVKGVDLTVQYDGGVPVFKFDWTTGVEGAAPRFGNNGHLINYRGGPFVVDGSDFDRASAVLRSFRSTFGSVNVHVSNVAFRGYSKRTMAGGWSAGGAVPPKLALLDIGSDGAGAKNSEVVIQGYLTQAGLDTTGAMGYANPANGPHGEIFDRLFLPDFLATPTGSSWTTSRLAQNGYQILWVPHWTAPSSCSDCPPSTSCTCQVDYPVAQIAETLRNVGSFVNSVNPATNTRGDLFAECAGLGSFEGVLSSKDPTGYNLYYVLASEAATGGEPTTHFQTTTSPTAPRTGVWINRTPNSALYHGSFGSPLMQIGDFTFVPFQGAIQNFKANQYKSEVVRLISEATYPDYDIFTLVPGTASHGTVVYLGGHSYSGTDGDFQIAGSRLVLNTLFNLGSSCIANSGVPCKTGLPGACAFGHYACQAGAPDPVCVADVQPGELTEICNGVDDDCDGQVDEELQKSCYEMPAGYADPRGRTGSAFLATAGVGLCHPGVSVCQRNADGTYAMSACTGQVTPEVESCNGLDDDCNGVVDDPDALPTIACYDGPSSTLNVGICRGGEQVCRLGQWGGLVNGVFVQGACAGEVLPTGEICSDTGGGQIAKDDDCDGQVNNGCTCTTGAHQKCFSGPGTAGVGTCQMGEQECVNGAWGKCIGEVVGTTESCVPGDVFDAGHISTSLDTNCDGRFTRCTDCRPGDVDPLGCPTSALPVLPDGATWGVGQCLTGSRTCTAAGTWGTCEGYILPRFDPNTNASTDPRLIEYCNGIDDNCNGAIDEGALCPPGETCLKGVCVQKYCGTEQPPPEGYSCSAGVDADGLHTVVVAGCGDTHPTGCAMGQLCQYGNCVDPCPVTTSVVGGSVVTSGACATGTVCAGGACIAGGCYEAGCPASGEVCVRGACVADPCASKLCPSGTFCRQGDCVQACTFVSCFVGEKCGVDGFCETDPCAGKLCGAGQRCTNGVCAADPCLGKGCATGQICDGRTGTAVCVDDPCTGVVCPAGVCADGQCFPTGNPTGAGTMIRNVVTQASKSGGCHCGSGAGAALPALLALLLAPLTRRRRRAPGGGRGALLVVLLSVAVAATGCKSSKKTTTTTFDPSKCTATCPGENVCIDISKDPMHCGPNVAIACGHACDAGQQCVDGVCGPTTLIAPFLSGSSPASGIKDNPALVVSLAGERFRLGANVRISTGGSTSTVTCGADPFPAADAASPDACQFLSERGLSLRLNLTDASPAVPWTLRVVNPDGVISNPRSLTITIPTPTITSVAPPTVPAGSTATLTVTGTGYTSGSRCHLAIPGVPNGSDLKQGDTTPTPTQLSCVLDATSLSPGTYPLTVIGELLDVSNAVTVSVLPSNPVIYALEPSSIDPLGVATTASFLIKGLRLDPATAQVLFYQGAEAALPAANVTRLGDSGILVHDLQVGPNTSYPSGASGTTYTVAVRTGTTGAYRTSNTVGFTVGAATRAVTSFSPSIAYQGDVVRLAFSGSGFAAGTSTRVELQAPGASTFSPIATDPVTVTTLVTATTSFAGQPSGVWYVRLRFGANATDPTSAPWPLRILSNQAILRDYYATPDPAQAGTVGGTKTSFVFSVWNVRSRDVKIYLVDPDGLTSRQLVPTLQPEVDTTTLVFAPTTPWPLAGFGTGTWTFHVANPGADLSNGLNFAVNPGYPSLTSVCVTGTNCTRYAVQGQSVKIRLTGANFARPDASGNGSLVMAAADLSPATLSGWPTPDPCDVITTAGTQFQPVPGTVSVVDPQHLDVQLDPLAPFVDPDWGTTYYLGVWNPGGVAGLQKSSCGVDPRTLPWFRICAKATGTSCTQ